MALGGYGGRTPDAQMRMMTKVALMYHEEGKLQSEIAKSLDLSQARVSRLLKRAEKVGIIRTTVAVTPGLHTDLERQLEAKYGLQEAVVFDVDEAAPEDAVLSTIGSGAAGYLESYLAGNERIGVSSWSRTLAATVERLRPLNGRPASQVVQLLGGTGTTDRQNNAQQLLSRLSDYLGATPFPVNAPGVVADSSIRDALFSETSLREVTEQWHSLTLALVGIGSVQPSATLADSGNTISAEDLDALVSAGAVGNVCYNYFDADGKIIQGELSDRTISISAEEFLRIPRRVGLAGGPSKHRVIEAALKGGLVNVLITDSVTAQYLLRDN